MSLVTPETVRKLQAALHAKAKGAPTYRFYSLYDKVCRRDVLTYAYERCRQNAGRPGVDGQTFEAIEASRAGRWLDALMQDLRDRTYRPSPIRRVFIPKPDGKQRPLGIGTIRDRVAQMAMVVVLESIFEADLPPEQYAYRAGRSAQDAVRHVHALVNAGYTEVVDADLSGYFDSIPHPELLKSVARRVSDGHVLALIKAWLEAPVEEADRRGTPQGSPLTPPTIWQNAPFGAFSKRGEVHPVDHSDLLRTDLDAPDQRRTISRRVDQSASSRPAFTRSANSCSRPITRRNSRSCASSSCC